VGENGLDVFLGGGTAGAISMILVGGIVGWLSTLLGRVQEQSRQLAIAEQKAQEASRLKTELLSKVSHDLRTPLGAILGYTELVIDEVYGPVNPKQQEKLAEVVNSARELEVLVDDLLDVSRIEGGRLQLSPELFSPAQLLKQIGGKGRLGAEAKGLTFTTQLDPDLPPQLWGDVTRISQIVQNLVDNAIKYTDTGAIRLRFARRDQDQWLIQVTDSGVGIPEEDQAYIFDTFRQVDAAVESKNAGVGLGLSIVKELTDLMGGATAVESEVGKGSAFTVTLPLKTTEDK
jgi:signal transduction histidine kinase